MNANDVELALRARAAFNDSVDRIDADTRRRLRDLRLRAQHGKQRRTTPLWAWPAGAALAASLTLVAFMPRLLHDQATAAIATVHVAQSNTGPAVVRVDDAIVKAQASRQDPLEVVDPDMLSDLDFYGWLAKQPSVEASGG
ncbi:MAG: hypothetical protein ABIT64_06280 [Lysobacteraceae bacterium]